MQAITNETTSIQVTPSELFAIPPALPFPLLRRKTGSTDAWLTELCPEARAILEQSRRTVAWPLRPRITGVVARPA